MKANRNFQEAKRELPLTESTGSPCSNTDWFQNWIWIVLRTDLAKTVQEHLTGPAHSHNKTSSSHPNGRKPTTSPLCRFLLWIQFVPLATLEGEEHNMHQLQTQLASTSVCLLLLTDTFTSPLLQATAFLSLSVSVSSRSKVAESNHSWNS